MFSSEQSGFIFLLLYMKNELINCANFFFFVTGFTEELNCTGLSIRLSGWSCPFANISIYSFTEDCFSFLLKNSAGWWTSLLAGLMTHLLCTASGKKWILYMYIRCSSWVKTVYSHKKANLAPVWKVFFKDFGYFNVHFPVFFSIIFNIDYKSLLKLRMQLVACWRRPHEAV